MTLEDLIADTVKRGEFSHLSIVHNASGKGFTAAFMAATKGYHMATDRDPVVAIRKAILESRKRGPRAKQEDNGFG